MDTQVKFVAKHHEQLIEVLKAHFGNKPIKGMDIGTNAGDSAKALLLHIPNLKMLYTVDPWKSFPGAQFEAGNTQEYHDAQKEAALHKLEEYKDRVTIMQMTSDEAYMSLTSINHLGEDIDFVWIDGHHEKSQVLKDIENGLTLLGGRQAALIGGHDYGLVDDVKPVVDGIFKDKVHTGGDFTWWVFL